MQVIVVCELSFLWRIISSLKDQYCYCTLNYYENCFKKLQIIYEYILLFTCQMMIYIYT